MKKGKARKKDSRVRPVGNVESDRIENMRYKNEGSDERSCPE
jgi:hypothetical protein